MKRIFVLYLAAALAMAQSTSVLSGENGMMSRAETLEMLRNKAAADGIVRVIVTIATPAGTADNSANIESAKLLLQNALPMDDAPLVQPIEGQPLVVMEVTPRGLDWLADAPMVERIEPDSLTGIPPVEGGAPGVSPDIGGGDDGSPSFGGGGSNDLSAPQSN